MPVKPVNAKKAKTIDGSPTRRASINVEPPNLLKNPESGVVARLAKIYGRVNEVMSGMYTGVGCVGTPHEHHSYDEKTTPEKPSK